MSEPIQPHELGQRQSAKRASTWKLGGLRAIQVARRVWREMDVNRDDVFGRSAELAFYFFLAALPLMIFFLTIFGLLAGHSPTLAHHATDSLARILPGSANGLIQRELQQTQIHAAGWLLAAGIVGALWSGSAGIAALITTLDIAYDVKPRPVWRQRALAIGLTIVLGVLIVAAIAIGLLGGVLVQDLGGATGLGGVLRELWRVGEYAIAIFFVVLAYAVLYRWGPNRKERKWEWITPGALVGVLLWIAASVGLRIYLHYFKGFSATYGSLGAVIVLLLWFYITGFSMLTGAEVNAVIEDAAAKRGQPGAEAKGQKRAA